MSTPQHKAGGAIALAQGAATVWSSGQRLTDGLADLSHSDIRQVTAIGPCVAIAGIDVSRPGGPSGNSQGRSAAEALDAFARQQDSCVAAREKHSQQLVRALLRSCCIP